MHEKKHNSMHMIMHMIGKESTLEHSIISQITILMLHVIKMYAKQYA